MQDHISTVMTYTVTQTQFMTEDDDNLFMCALYLFIINGWLSGVVVRVSDL